MAPGEGERGGVPARLEPDDGCRYLRTGDLGFLRDDELHVVGRLKDLLIVRGRNIAPQDLERSIEQAHLGMRPGCGAVFQVEPPAAEPRLVAVQEFDPASGADPEAAIRAARQAVAREFEIELDAMALIAPRTIPKTSSGKIQRRGCRYAYENGALTTLAAWRAPQTGPDEAELAMSIEAYLGGLPCATWPPRGIRARTR